MFSAFQVPRLGQVFNSTVRLTATRLAARHGNRQGVGLCRRMGHPMRSKPSVNKVSHHAKTGRPRPGSTPQWTALRQSLLFGKPPALWRPHARQFTDASKNNPKMRTPSTWLAMLKGLTPKQWLGIGATIFVIPVITKLWDNIYANPAAKYLEELGIAFIGPEKKNQSIGGIESVDETFQGNQTVFWKSAKQDLLMMGISGREFLRKDRVDDIKALLRRNPTFTVRMLIMDPNSTDINKDTIYQEGTPQYNPGLSPSLRKNLEHSLKHPALVKLKKEFGHRFELRLMKRLPVYTIDLIDSLPTKPQKQETHTSHVDKSSQRNDAKKPHIDVEGKARVVYRSGLKNWNGEDAWTNIPVIIFQNTGEDGSPFNTFSRNVNAIWEKGSRPFQI